jgi:hypothetical protein
MNITLTVASGFIGSNVKKLYGDFLTNNNKLKNSIHLNNINIS